MGQALGIRQIQAGLTPGEKLEAIRGAREARGRETKCNGVIMVSRLCLLDLNATLSNHSRKLLTSESLFRRPSTKPLIFPVSITFQSCGFIDTRRDPCSKAERRVVLRPYKGKRMTPIMKTGPQISLLFVSGLFKWHPAIARPLLPL